MARQCRAEAEPLSERHSTSDSGLQMSSAGDIPEMYPVDTNGFVRQCAWCRRIADADGRYRLVSAALVHGASHGCCEACAIRLLGHGMAQPWFAA